MASASKIKRLPDEDKSTKPPSSSSTVNTDTTRSSTTPNQKPLGPRTA